jgi:hypothetical protein
MLVAFVSLPARSEDAPGIAWPEPGGRASISAPFKGSPITVGVSSRTAGSIDSLTWGGTQFVNAFDHGRELQSASSFDGFAECLNPTEAGSNADGAGRRSSSLLLGLSVGDGRLETRTRMAYWMRPGDLAGSCPKGPGAYSSPLSDDLLDKRVVIGAAGVPNAIAYRATFTTATPHAEGTFEAATGYMPPQFDRFWTYDPATGALDPLSPGPGEQAKPVILATPDGQRAMGVYSPDLPQAGQAAGYGRFDFSKLAGAGNGTVKWNCVFRERGIKPGAKTYTCYVLVGTLEDVTQGISALRTALTGHAGPPPKPSQAEARGPLAQERRTLGAPPEEGDDRTPDAGGGEGTPLYVGTQAECNAGIVTVDPAFRRCATAPLGATLGDGGDRGETALYVVLAPRDAAGVVTTNPHHLGGQTRPIGFLAPRGSAGAPLYVGTGQECNAGVVSSNPRHLGCATAAIGSVPR